MPWYYIVLISVAVILFFIILALATGMACITLIIFGVRQDKNAAYKYFTPEDFGIDSRPLNVDYRDVKLSSAVYTARPVEECDRVVIFAHGFGAGSSSYMTEIAHFAKRGYAVVATDAYGCNNSACKSIIGFYAGAEAVIATYIAVKSDESLKGKKIILVGHSWGAYSVLAACDKVAVDGVVALSAFNAPAQCVCDFLKGLRGIVRIYSPFLHGFFYLANFFKFGPKGNTKAVKAVEKSGVKALLVHGKDDKEVALKHSAAYLAKGENITSLILDGKRHNPYATAAAEDKLAQLDKNFDTETEEVEYFKDFDWSAATEEDGEVMAKIDAFIASV